MFYEVDQIEKILNCRKCNNGYDVPKILPCGENVCQTCLNQVIESFRSWDITQSHLQFSCPICECKHDIPEFGAFRTDLTIQRILQEKPREVWRGERIDLLKKYLHENKSMMKNISETLKNDDMNLVIDRFDCLRSELKHAFMLQMEYLNQANNTLLNKINSTEKNFLSQIDIAKTKTLPKMVKEMDQLDEEMKINLNKHDFHTTEIERSVTRTANIQTNVKKEVSALMALSKDFQQYEFKVQPKNIDSNHIGVFQKRIAHKETITIDQRNINR